MSNEETYEELARNLVISAMEGINGKSNSETVISNFKPKISFQNHHCEIITFIIIFRISAILLNTQI